MTGIIVGEIKDCAREAGHHTESEGWTEELEGLARQRELGS